MNAHPRRKNRRRNGFTLIELLVVIAIIGIHASIILASLGASRSKGIDAAIKSEVGEARTLLEFNANDYKSYANLQPNKWKVRLIQVEGTGQEQDVLQIRKAYLLKLV